MLKYVGILFLVSTIYCERKWPKPEKFGHNNPMQIPDNIVTWPHFGEIHDIYKTEHEVRNILVPFSGYNSKFEVAPGTHPPVYFNMINNGSNLGQYVIINKEMHYINDGRDSTADYPPPDGRGDFDKNVYIGTPDGIYVYNPETQNVEKYGNLTEDILAIDKVTAKDEIYILTTDHKIYLVTDHGTVKTPVQGIDYAKDFVLDFLEALYFLGEDNKPQVLVKGQSVPYKFVEFDFDVINPILGRPIESFTSVSTRNEYNTPFMVDGVPYNLAYANIAVPMPSTNRVPGLTAYSAEYMVFNYYAVDGKIYMHDILEKLRIALGLRNNGN